MPIIDENTKICEYQKCRDVFTKPPKMHAGTWEQITRCPTCRKKAHRPRPLGSFQPETNLGRYEVKNAIIDRFLYG